MPGIEEHKRLCGLVSGLTAGGLACLDPGASFFQVAFETTGGVVAGRSAAALPDIVDPANCWAHRGIGHAILPAGAALTYVAESIPAWQKACREQARLAEAALAVATTPMERAWQFCLAALWYMAAGAFVGAPMGYVVHLLQDGQTPQGLPLLMRGF